MTKPLVTVTIPTFSRARLLARTIQSVLDQSVADIEIFVSDNASTDATSDVVASFGDPRLHYLRNHRNVGHFANLTRGLHLGTAPYAVVLPDDDVMLPNHLEHKLGILEGHPDVGFVHSGFLKVSEGVDSNLLDERVELPGGNTDRVSPGLTVVRRILAGSYRVAYATAVFRRTIIDEAECFAAIDRGADDVGISLRLARRSAMVAYSAEPLVAVALHPGAQNSRAGGQECFDGDYVITFRSIRDVKDAKERFLDRFGSEFPDEGALRMAVRRHAQENALSVVRIKTEPRRSPPTVGRLLLEATRVEPGVLVYGPTLRYLASSLAGRALRDAVRRCRTPDPARVRR